MRTSNPLLPDLTGDDLMLAFGVLFVALVLVVLAAVAWEGRGRGQHRED